MLETTLTLYFDYAQNFYIFSISVRYPFITSQTSASINSFNISNVFQASVYVKAIP